MEGRKLPPGIEEKPGGVIWAATSKGVLNIVEKSGKKMEKEKKELFVVCCRYRLIRLGGGGGERGSLVKPRGGREGKVGERRGQVSEKERNMSVVSDIDRRYDRRYVGAVR